MSLNEKFGRGSSNIRKVQMPDTPDVSDLQKLLSDLSTSAAGAQCDVLWQQGSNVFTLNLIHSRQTARANWKLYRGRGLQPSLIWDYNTNDVAVVHKMILIEMQRQTTPTASGLRLPALNASGTVREERRAININSNLSTKLRGLFIGAQEDLTAKAKIKSAPVPLINQPVSTKLPDKPVPVIEYVDLLPGRRLLEQLFVNQFGMFSYPTFLFFLEREFYEAVENNSPTTLVVFQAINTTNPAALISPVVFQEIVKRMKHTQRKTDIFAQVEDNKFVVLLPDTNAAGAKSFVRRVEKALFKSVLAPELSHTAMKFAFGIASLGEHCKTLPTLLFLSDKALERAQQLGTDMISDQDILDEGSIDLREAMLRQVDLKPTQLLVSELISGGIFTHPAFVAFLEHEYHRSARKKRELLIVLFKVRLLQATFDQPTNSLPDQAFYEVIRRIGSLLSKRDIFAHYGKGNFVIMRSNTSLSQMQTFTKRAVQALTGDEWLTPECPTSSLRFKTQICSVRQHGADPNVLGLVAAE